MTGKFVLIVFFMCWMSMSLWAQPNMDRAKKIPELFNMLEKFHYHPPKRGQMLSDRIFDQLIRNLDPNSLLFSAQSLKSFDSYRNELCSDSIALHADFISLLTRNYHAALLKSDSIIDRFFLAPVSFSGKDTLTFRTESGSFCLANNDQELNQRWQKWLKAGMLKSLIYSSNDSLFNPKKQVPDSLYSVNSMLVRKSRIREERFIYHLLNPSEGVADYVWNIYLNTIASCYDPHTNYFSPDEKEKFESSLSKDNYAFGFNLGRSLTGEVMISDVFPRSPMWYENKFEKGDVLLKIKVPGQDVTDLAFAEISEVDEIFDELKGDRVQLTVRKPDGQIVTGDIVKGNFDAKQNLTLGFILKGEKPLGYLWFSGFYTEFNQYGSIGCSIDFLKEMVKLKESGVQGLIIDLRNNPGGSEGEAMEIAGYFLGNASISTRVNKDGVKIPLRIVNSTRWYDGPVVVLVNSSSASASELLAGVLQDYNRALILGTNTFGKATEQLILPLGRKMKNPFQFSSDPEAGSEDFIKITSGKIYRVTGKSYQKSGVKPDVRIPDAMEKFATRESDLPFAFKNDSVSPSFQFTPWPALPVDSLRKLSQNRISGEDRFKTTSRLEKSMAVFSDDQQKVSLNLAQYRKEAAQRMKLIGEFDSLQKIKNEKFEVAYSSFKKQELASDSVMTEINDKFKDHVQKDLEVEEAWSVLLDLVKIKEGDK